LDSNDFHPLSQPVLLGFDFELFASSEKLLAIMLKLSTFGCGDGDDLGTRFFCADETVGAGDGCGWGVGFRGGGA
jgi:hypothetical protein